MTLCIAAPCYLDVTGFETTVALVFDRKIETETASAETAFKLEFLSTNWYALLAGPLVEARELTDRYKVMLKAHEDSITNLNVLDYLREPFQAARRAIADDYTQAKLAMPYADFLANGATQVPDDLRRQIAYDISAQKINAELILIGIVDRGFKVFSCFGGEVFRNEDFAAIGSGYLIAESVLYQREQHTGLGLEETLYEVVLVGWTKKRQSLDRAAGC